MATLRTNKKYAKIRDAQQCQICGATLPVPFRRLEVHHIIFRSRAGSDNVKNLVTLCDLCHAVIHQHMGPAWVGLSKFSQDERNEAKQLLEQAREEFDSYLRLPTEKRHRIQEEIWAEWGIQNLKRVPSEEQENRPRCFEFSSFDIRICFGFRHSGFRILRSNLPVLAFKKSLPKKQRIYS